jgi:flavin-dependent thymidylate synthase
MHNHSPDKVCDSECSDFQAQYSGDAGQNIASELRRYAAAKEVINSSFGKDIAKYADVAMYEAEPDGMALEEGHVEPRVTLVSMTHDPLRVMAAASELYAGRVIYEADDIQPEEALRWLSDMTKTKLQAPLEFIDLHFLFEGVTRAFTHQLVRQRTAVYVQESQRFAVKSNAEFEVAYPPSIADLGDDDANRLIWDGAIKHVTRSYQALINAGVPAEDARGLLPTNITTRVHYKTNLRALVEHAGMRLCTQAQYEWKQVWAGMIAEILRYGPDSNRWQQKAIASLFKPVCYNTGRCGFRAETDRFCSIRERVETHYAHGEAPDTWTDINPLEPLHEGTARLRPEGR